MNWFQKIAQKIQLPPIPPGFVRLTHFTQPQWAQLIMQNGFKHKEMLSSTTDLFADNNGIVSLIQSGKTGPWTRSKFGEYVVLMDVTNKEWKLRSGQAMGGQVPSNNVVGYVERASGKFVPNSNYQPTDNTKQLLTEIQGRKERNFGSSGIEQIPIPGADKGKSLDVVW